MGIMEKTTILEGMVSEEKRTKDWSPSVLRGSKISIRTSKEEEEGTTSEIMALWGFMSIVDVAFPPQPHTQSNGILGSETKLLVPLT